MLLIREEKPSGQEIQALLEASDAYSMALYPDEGRHPVDISFLNSPQIRFFVARLDGLAVGCVALVISDDTTAELKRMIVLPTARGQGVGSILLRYAEDVATKNNVRVIRLETGPLSRGALSLYGRHGYRERGPFGTYKPSPHSVFMEKRLSGTT
jgi:putative acetyltransferase